LKRILHADSVWRRLKQYSISFAAARHWLVSATMSLGIRCRNKGYQYSLSKEPLPLYKRHRVTESVLNVTFRVAQ
jgi:hypothetical protein